MPNERRFFRQKAKVTGRHDSFDQALEGEYAFRKNPGHQTLFEAYNSVTKELQEIIAACVQDGKSLRARGSLWSLSTAAVNDGRLLDTTTLRIAFSLPQDRIDPNYNGDFTKLRFVECGYTIAELNKKLFADRLSLKASGSNNGQTIAGALSTGTHGGAFDFGAISEMVVGLHLVVGPNKHVYLQRASHPVVKKSFADALGAEFKTDDDLFNAALISFGSFGVIHGIMIEARDLFLLNAVRFLRPYDDTLKAALKAGRPDGLTLPDTIEGKSTAGIPTDSPYHFEVFYNPNEGTPPDNAIMVLMYDEPWTPAYEPPIWGSDEAGMGAAGLDLMGILMDLIPQPLNKLTVGILNDQVADEFAPYYRKAAIRDLFRGEKVQGKTMACGVAVPAERCVEALDVCFKVYKDEGDVLPLILSHRFVKGTQATLGFTRFPKTAVLEIDSLNLDSTRAYLHKVWNALDAAGIPFTLHWGKFNMHLNAQQVRSRYGAAVDDWIAAREDLLENAEVRQVFANDFIRNLGLAT